MDPRAPSLPASDSTGASRRWIRVRHGRSLSMVGYRVMVGVKGTEMVPVPLDHPMIRTARAIGLCLGD